MWSRDNRAQLVSSRALAPRTELTIDYVSNGDDNGDEAEAAPADGDGGHEGGGEGGGGRREWLRAHYGFVCQCEVCCTLPAAP